MPEHDSPQINIDVETAYIESQSIPDRNHYVFSYTITIQNSGSQAAKLLSRHWLITDANGKTQEVSGEGVVGQTPLIAPGEAFTYTSGTALETPVGSMRGEYRMRSAGGDRFDAPIPAFTLAIPKLLH